jgi:hypothetical protein
VKPETSTNSTVTCLRSPSSALADVRIFSARCFGVYARGEAYGPAAGAWSAAPQAWQKRLPGGLAARHSPQTVSSRAPQAPQNRATAGLSWPQPGQVMAQYSPCLSGLRRRLDVR